MLPSRPIIEATSILQDTEDWGSQAITPLTVHQLLLPSRPTDNCGNFHRPLQDPEDWGSQKLQGGSSDSEDAAGGGLAFRAPLDALPGITEEAPFELRALEVTRAGPPGSPAVRLFCGCFKLQVEASDVRGCCHLDRSGVLKAWRIAWQHVPARSQFQQHSRHAVPGGRRHVRMRWSQVVLDFVTMFLEYLVTELERVAHPVLDAIVQKVWLPPEQRVDTVPADSLVAVPA